MILYRFPSENNTHEKARLRPASGTQTCLLVSGDPRADFVCLKPFAACGVGGGSFDYRSKHTPKARRQSSGSAAHQCDM